ncbi:very low-density lipoprotein receptor-like [Patiria miniata]|uniref:Uncharacterized protein n=1 Tax=Patiria miniata TaxID=46514 RepID=A0A914AS87_PATMI|nr:very low-density lipoprotein receptor-like [Patiria miniata]
MDVAVVDKKKIQQARFDRTGASRHNFVYRDVMFQCTDDDDVRCENQFGGDCIPGFWRCDGWADCKNAEDEQDCASYSWYTGISSFDPDCGENDIYCENKWHTECVPYRWRCDGFIDCIDKQDEENCEDKREMDVGVVDKKKMQQARFDRTGASRHNFVYRDVMFQCTDDDDVRCENQFGGDCIPGFWRCDGWADCKNAEDEQDCASYSWYTGISSFDPDCGENDIYCENKWHTECVPYYWRCDGFIDCIDKQDEENCEDKREMDVGVVDKKKMQQARFDRTGASRHNFVYRDVMFQCTDDDDVRCENQFGGDCIPGFWRCDGWADCKNAEDEQDCASYSWYTGISSFDPDCGENDIYCENKWHTECVPYRWRCDGFIDCIDKQDEENCEERAAASRRNFVNRNVMFECTHDDDIRCENRYNGDCIPGSWRCDGLRDCKDGEDEQDCPSHSSSWSFSYSDGGMFECTDDAIHCENPFGDCIPADWRCDYIYDCDDNQDEENCKDKRK